MTAVTEPHEGKPLHPLCVQSVSMEVTCGKHSNICVMYEQCRDSIKRNNGCFKKNDSKLNYIKDDHKME